MRQELYEREIVYKRRIVEFPASRNKCVHPTTYNGYFIYMLSCWINRICPKHRIYKNVRFGCPECHKEAWANRKDEPLKTRKGPDSRGWDGGF